jgi:hypothetical protein
LLLHLKSPCIRRPAIWELRENKPLPGCQTGNGADQAVARTTFRITVCSAVSS